MSVVIVVGSPNDVKRLDEATAVLDWFGISHEVHVASAHRSPRKVLELHGTMHEVVCTGCGARTPSRATLARVEAGERDPGCVDCGRILKLAVVMFGEHLDGTVAGYAQRIATHSGLPLRPS